MIKYAIASDHAGFALKEAIKAKFGKAVSFEDLGPSSDDRVDYPDFGRKLGQAVQDGKFERGIVICGSGIGISIAANRFPKVRAALCMTSEMAELARQHNDANVLALGQRLVDEATAFAIIEAFMKTEFEGGRHEGRVAKLEFNG
jgi:ribose 5-phosphate isomerase B